MAKLALQIREPGVHTQSFGSSQPFVVVVEVCHRGICCATRWVLFFCSMKPNRQTICSVLYYERGAPLLYWGDKRVLYALLLETTRGIAP